MADEQKKGEQQKKAKPAKGDKGHAQVEAKPSPDAPRHAAKERPRLRARFEKEVAVALMKELELKNTMAVPRLNKIVVNMGVGEATQNAKLIDPAVNELGQIAGQKPVVTRAKKSIAAFKVREGMPIGAMVTPVSYTHLRAHETRHDLVCRLLLEKKKTIIFSKTNI